MPVDLDYPGLPRSWRGEHVRKVVYDRGPVAVIGDIHGRADLLRVLLDQLGPEVPIVTVGDVCDRGPDTRGVLDLLIERRAIGVLGNHDLRFAACAAGEGFDRLALGMGGVATVRSYGVSIEEAEGGRGPDVVPAAHRNWLLGVHVVLDLWVGDERYWVVHAGIPTDGRFPEGTAVADVVPRLAVERTTDLLWRATDREDRVPVDRPDRAREAPAAPRTGRPHACDRDRRRCDNTPRRQLQRTPEPPQSCATWAPESYATCDRRNSTAGGAGSYAPSKGATAEAVMGLLAEIGEALGALVGGLIGAIGRALGDATGSPFIREVGEGADETTRITGQTVGQITEGGFHVARGLVTKDDQEVSEGLRQGGRAAYATVRRTAIGLRRVGSNAHELAVGLAQGDLETAARAGRELANGHQLRRLL